MNSLKYLYMYIRGLGFLLAWFLLPYLSIAQRVTGPLGSPGTLGEYYNYNNGSVILKPGFTSAPGSGQLLYLHILTTEAIPINLGLSADQNYVLTSVPRASGYVAGTSGYNTSQLMQSVQYLDGLGRPIQTVQVEGSNSGADVVQPMAYDAYGREAVKYLPYAANTFDGSFKTNALTDQGSFYAAPPSGVSVNTYPSASTGFEPSLMDRPAEQGAPGAPWQLTGSGITGSGNTVKIAYGVNTDHEVIFWQVNAGGATSGTTAQTYYPAGRLTTTITTDENGNSTTLYKDLNGRVVSRKAPDGFATSYIYDDLGNLAYVVPPIPSAYPVSFAEGDAVFLNFFYGYHYDGRKRLIEKKIPGKDWEYMIYNQTDQLVATQDGNLKADHEWMFTKYNGVAQVVQTGLYANTTDDRNAIQTTVNSYVKLWEVAQNADNGYTDMAWPQSNMSTLTLNYYDGYSLIPGLPVAYSAPAGASNMTRGLLTASSTTILGQPDALWTAHYYDGLGRITQSYAQHYLGGHANYSTANYDKVANTYNFSNQVTATARQHYTLAAGLALTIGNSYTYDHVGRKLQTYQQINGGLNVMLSQLTYNEVGQLRAKHLHSEDGGASFLQNVNYAYNERGWTTGTGSTLFSLDLRYNDPAVATPKFNGDISEMYYTGQQSNRMFTYTYDVLDRLTVSNSNGANLDETIGYNSLGNITGLTRSGTGYGALTYAYTGNQLTGVTGSGFTSRSYTYDPNGNATGDGGSKTIQYNVLNLPLYLFQGGSAFAEMDYDANGTKLRTTSTHDSTFDYISGIVYRNNVIAYMQTEEGRAVNEGGTYDYHYDLKDQLGNNRIEFDKNPSTGAARELQEDEYYAFGLRSNLFGINNGNRYLYNGKEIQTDLTNQYDYGARFYDPVIARWTTPDPMTELNRSWSPYNYTKGNPISRIDPDGMYDVDAGYGTTVQSSTQNYSLTGGSLSDLQNETKTSDVASATIKPTGSNAAGTTGGTDLGGDTNINEPNVYDPLGKSVLAGPGDRNSTLPVLDPTTNLVGGDELSEVHIDGGKGGQSLTEKVLKANDLAVTTTSAVDLLATLNKIKTTGTKAFGVVGDLTGLVSLYTNGQQAVKDFRSGHIGLGIWNSTKVVGTGVFLMIGGEEATIGVRGAELLWNAGTTYFDFKIAP